MLLEIPVNEFEMLLAGLGRSRSIGEIFWPG
jgi:hypothetical protein